MDFLQNIVPKTKMFPRVGLSRKGTANRRYSKKKPDVWTSGAPIHPFDTITETKVVTETLEEHLQQDQTTQLTQLQTAGTGDILSTSDSLFYKAVNCSIGVILK